MKLLELRSHRMRGWYFRATSPIDDAPLIVVLTRGTTNPKTGRVIQSFILREDVEPREALDSGQDRSICGDCPQRPFLGGRCYVRLHQGSQSIWQAYHRGSYRFLDVESSTISRWARGDPLRLGSYGDPAMVPAPVWRQIIAMIGSDRSWTGFSHMWRESWAQDHRSLCMASVESMREALEAQAMGWRTFRTTLERDYPKLRNEFSCPASREGGRRLTCRQCAACNGNPHSRDAERAGSVVIREHGPRTKKLLHEPDWRFVRSEEVENLSTKG